MKQVCVGSGGVGFEVLKVVDERERLCAGISDRLESTLSLAHTHTHTHRQTEPPTQSQLTHSVPCKHVCAVFSGAHLTRVCVCVCVFHRWTKQGWLQCWRRRSPSSSAGTDPSTPSPSLPNSHTHTHTHSAQCPVSVDDVAYLMKEGS